MGDAEVAQLSLLIRTGLRTRILDQHPLHRDHRAIAHHMNGPVTEPRITGHQTDLLALGELTSRCLHRHPHMILASVQILLLLGRGCQVVLRQTTIAQRKRRRWRIQPRRKEQTGAQGIDDILGHLVRPIHLLCLADRGLDHHPQISIVGLGRETVELAGHDRRRAAFGTNSSNPRAPCGIAAIELLYILVAVRRPHDPSANANVHRVQQDSLVPHRISGVPDSHLGARLHFRRQSPPVAVAVGGRDVLLAASDWHPARRRSLVGSSTVARPRSKAAISL